MEAINSDSPSPPDSPGLTEVRALILEACGPALLDFGIRAEDAPGDLDLRGSGMIDSLGFVEVIVEVEEKLDLELDLDDMDPEQLTVLDPLAAYIAAQAAAKGSG